MSVTRHNNLRAPRRRCVRQSGFLLLEVVVAVGLLVMGMAVIGAQLQSASDRAIQTDQMSRIVFLAESKLAELNTGMVQFELEQEEEFGHLFPSYGWRLLAVPIPEDPNPTSPRHPLDTPMVALTLQILFDPDRDMEAEEEFDFEEAVVVQAYYTLRTLPRPLDLTTDFGLDAERAAEINEQLAGVGDGTMDVNELNPAMFRDMSMEELLEVLPVLMPALGIGEDSVLNMVPAELRPLLEAIFAEQREGGDGASDGGGDTGDDGSVDGGTDGSGTSDGGSGGGNDAGADALGDEIDGEGMGDGQDAPPDDSGAEADPNAPDDPDVNSDDDEQPRRGERRGGGRRGGGRRGGR